MTRALFHTVWHFTYTLWLFTYSDLKTIVVPKTAFGIITLLSGSCLTTDPQPQSSQILWAVPFIMTWIWINLLPLTIINQWSEDSILEDRENKPWRPIPAERLSAKEARRLVAPIYAVAVLGSAFLGCSRECIALIVEGWI